MARDGRRLRDRFSLENVGSLAASITLKKNLVVSVRLSLI
jgi:hypothetical protein